MKVLSIDEFNENYPYAAIDTEASFPTAKELIESIVKAVEKTGHEFVFLHEVAEVVIVMK